MLRLVTSALLLGACGSAPGPAPVARVEPMTPAQVTDVPPRRCALDPATPLTRPASAAPPCRMPTAATQETITQAIAKRFMPEQPNGKPVLSFACDGLGARVTEIVVELGNGHGGSLSMWRARLDATDTYQVHGLVYRGASRIRPLPQPPFQQVTGSVSLATIEPRLAVVRAALASTLREVAPPPPPGSASGTSHGSSRDFRVLVRLVDSDGRVREATYTGYQTSDAQDRFLAVAFAAEELSSITSLTPAVGPVTAGDRELFADRFNAAVPHFEDDFFWWVMERYVDLARALGTRAILPGLLGRVRDTGTDRPSVDARADAVEAIATITGWDARIGDAGEKRTIDEAAAAYAAECPR